MRSPWFGPVCIAAMLGYGFGMYDRLPVRLPIHAYSYVHWRERHRPGSARG